MTRRTLALTESVDALIPQMAQPGEPYTATVARLVQAGAGSLRGRKPPAFIGVVDGDGPRDLSRHTETYLRELLAER
jgi:hypothetical protein